MRPNVCHFRKFWYRATKGTLVQKITTYCNLVSLHGKNKLFGIFAWEEQAFCMGSIVIGKRMI